MRRSTPITAGAKLAVMTLDSVRCHSDTRLGNEAEHVLGSALFLIRVSESVQIPRYLAWSHSLSETIAPEFVLAPPTSPGFYPHSEWAALGPVQFGVRFQARVHQQQ